MKKAYGILTLAIIGLGLGLQAVAGGGGNGTHGGKMALCFFSQFYPNPVSDPSAILRYFKQNSDGDYDWKDPASRDSARSWFTASLWEIEALPDDLLATSLFETKWKDLNQDQALQAMYDEFRSVPKFYRMLQYAHRTLTMIGSPGSKSRKAEFGLHSIHDAGDIANLRPNCVPIQAAWRQDDVINYDSMIWDVATGVQRAALQLHEEVYFLGNTLFNLKPAPDRDRPHDTSGPTQLLIQDIALGGVDQTSIDTVASLTPKEADPEKEAARLAAAAVTARQNKLSSDLQDKAFGYYPTLHTLETLKSSAERDRLALLQALTALNGYCDGAHLATPRDVRKTKPFHDAGGIVAITAAAKSLPGIDARITSSSAPARIEVRPLIDAQNGKYGNSGLPGYSVFEGREDPEVLLLKAVDTLTGVAATVESDMSHRPISFDSRTGSDLYCRNIRKNLDDLAKAGTQLDGVNFFWDQSLPKPDGQ